MGSTVPQPAGAHLPATPSPVATSPPAGRPTFTGGTFLRETRLEVEAYLATAGTERRGRLQLLGKLVVASLLATGSWTALMLQPPLPLQLLSLCGLVTGVLLTGFCVQHDANHGAIFRSRRLSHLLGWTGDCIMGFSSYAWRVKHNVAHHTYTNVDGYDDDISQEPLARMLPAQTARSWHRWQHVYIWPLYALMLLRLQTFGDATAFRRGSIGRTALRLPRGWDLVGLLSGKALFVSWTIVLPLFVYTWKEAIIAYVVAWMSVSLVMASTFQLAHCVEEAGSATAEEIRAEPRDWGAHEVETTVDFCPQNRVLTWLLGGLNFQIEHHLFPRVPHTHYPRIAAIVERNAARHDIRYASQPSLRGAMRSHVRHLRALGRAGVPAEIEMG